MIGMTDKNDKEILNAVGRAWKEYRDSTGKPAAVRNYPQAFLDTLILVEKPWDAMELKHDERYWIISSSAEPECWVWRSDKYNLWHRATGNCHPTKEAAEAYYRLKMGLLASTKNILITRLTKKRTKTSTGSNLSAKNHGTKKELQETATSAD